MPIQIIMTGDLREILDGWEYEPGKISVRIIIGHDGREKIQTRVDLGVLQFEPTGRPDGRQPYGCESMLSFFEARLEEHIAQYGVDEDFVLLPEDCRDLRHEAHLYYQRYLSYFVLEEYEKVERDTERNLRLIDLCRKYAEADYDRMVMESQYAYVCMMNTRAQVYQAMETGRFDEALALLQQGRERILQLDENDDLSERKEQTSELEVLDELEEELLEITPPDSKIRIERDLKNALLCEDYERAAKLRDKLSACCSVNS